MTDLQIAWTELAAVGGLGILMALAGIVIDIAAKRRFGLCTEHTEGTVAEHRFAGGGRMYPIVEYFVNGVRYETKKKFRGVKQISISGFPISVQAQAYEDEKGWLVVKTGPVANLRPIAERLWPINSRMTVYYNPSRPEMCYVDRPIFGGFVTFMLVLMGLVTAALGVLVFFLMRL